MYRDGECTIMIHTAIHVNTSPESGVLSFLAMAGTSLTMQCAELGSNAPQVSLWELCSVSYLDRWAYIQLRIHKQCPHARDQLDYVELLTM